MCTYITNITDKDRYVYIYVFIHIYQNQSTIKNINLYICMYIYSISNIGLQTYEKLHWDRVIPYTIFS